MLVGKRPKSVLDFLETEIGFGEVEGQRDVISLVAIDWRGVIRPSREISLNYEEVIWWGVFVEFVHDYLVLWCAVVCCAVVCGGVLCCAESIIKEV